MAKRKQIKTQMLKIFFLFFFIMTEDVVFVDNEGTLYINVVDEEEKISKAITRKTKHHST